MVSMVDFWLGRERLFVEYRSLGSYLEIPSSIKFRHTNFYEAINSPDYKSFLEAMAEEITQLEIMKA